MKLFIADAFAEKHFGGNPAGVALLSSGEPFPNDTFMQQMAAELKHSETAFIHPENDGTFTLRYFTPAGEVDLCGHATIASFKVLQDEGLLTGCENTAHTNAGAIKVFVSGDSILMSMAPAKTIRSFDIENESDKTFIHDFYKAFGIDTSAMPASLQPQMITTGLPDIILAVKNKEILNTLNPDFDAITKISRALNAVGFHVFALHDGDNITADCRNFAPLYAINEEAATGTSNGALTWYLYQHHIIRPEMYQTFLQGEVMGRPSKIMSRLTLDGDIFIGGKAVILFRGEFEK